MLACWLENDPPPRRVVKNPLNRPGNLKPTSEIRQPAGSAGSCTDSCCSAKVLYLGFTIAVGLPVRCFSHEIDNDVMCFFGLIRKNAFYD